MSSAGTNAPAADAFDSLWERAWDWLCDLLTIFSGPDQIASVGLTRRMTMTARKWLWSVEAILRRVVIAAALDAGAALSEPQPRLPLARQRKAVRKASLPGLRIFSIHRAASQRDTQAQSPPSPAQPSASSQSGAAAPMRAPMRAKGRGHPHAACACDPLLAIGRAGAPRPRTPRAVSVFTVRRGRRSRWDPLHEYDAEEARRSLERYYFGPFRADRDCTMPDPPRHPPHEDWRFGHAPIVPCDRNALLDMEAEEHRLYPAPGLARRIAALERFAQDPKAAVHRLAQRLRRRPGLAELLRSAVWLAPGKRARSDKTPDPPAQALLALVCDYLDRRLRSPDTS